MDGSDPTAEGRARYEQEELSARGMLLLTGGLTSEGDAFLIGVLAAALMGGLYPLIGFWSMLAFPIVFIGAVVMRGRRRRRRSGGPARHLPR